MTARAWLVAYLAAVVAVTFIHEPLLLGLALAAALASAGKSRWRLLRRAALSVLAFNLSVSLGYVALAVWQGRFSGEYLLLVNLRVLLLVFLGFWFVGRVNLLAALAFSPTLSFIAALAASQAAAFSRIVCDFRLAFTSRNCARPGRVERLRHASSQVAFLLEKSAHAAGEAAMAMRSRGGGAHD